MAGIIVVDRIESDASYASSINIASPLVVANTISIGSNLAINSSGINAASIGFGTLPSNRIVFESNQSAVKTALNASGSPGIFAARAFVNFNGTTNVGGNCTIRASGNVSTVADNGTGDYTVNFTSAMPDSNYSLVGTAQSGSGLVSLGVEGASAAGAASLYSTTQAQIRCRVAAGTSTDSNIVNVSIFR